MTSSQAEPRVNFKDPTFGASAYLKAGLSVIPVAPREKRPAKGFGWEVFQKRLPTEHEVKHWFNGTNNNIAVVTGRVSRLAVFDIDGETAKLYAQYAIENKIRQDTRDGLSETLWSKTGGGGLHVWVRYNPIEFSEYDPVAREIKSGVLWRGANGHSEIRLKADGGYILAPPSIHPSGNAYSFIKGNKIAELSKEQILDLIQAFRSIGGNHYTIKQRDAANKQNDLDRIKEHSIPTTTLDDEQIMDIVVILRQYYLRGQRHEFVLFLAGWLRKEGIMIESARKVVEELAENDEELYDRLTTLNDTYQKNIFGDIRGFSGLVEILTAQMGSEQTARRIVKEVQSILPIQAKSSESNNNNVREDKTETADSNDADELTQSRTKKIAKKLIDIVSLNCPLLFVDQYNKPHVWATVVTSTDLLYREVIPIESKRFETFISGLYYTNTDGEVANKEAISDTIRILAAKAFFENQVTRELHLRVSWGEKNQMDVQHDEIYYDLTDQMRRCVRITSEGWQIIPHSEEVLFRRFGQLSQVEPLSNYQEDVFDKFLDLMYITDPHQRLLSKVLIISDFIPYIAHPIDLTHGEKGSVKTTFCRCVKRLVDPSMPELLTVPSDKREFAQQLYHNHLLLYDNVRSVPDWFSDEVCKAVTGGGISKRQLFTDDEDVVYDYKRCIKINGINIALVEPDALDRSIMSEYKRLPDDKRRSESEVLAEFERMKPQLLGYIMDTLVKALRIRPNLNLQRLPRMADVAIWGVAIGRALGYKEFEFIKAYDANIGAQNVEAIEASLIGPVVVRFASNLFQRTTTDKQEEKDQLRLRQDNDQGRGLLLWEGKPEDLLKALDVIAVSPEFSIDIKKARDYPKKANRLTKMLRPMFSNLREGYGIAITIESDTTGKKTGTKNARWIEIRKVSPPSPPSSPEENQAQNEGRNGEDASLDGEDGNSTTNKVSPPKQTRNDAHFEKSEAGEDGGDAFRLPLECGDSTSIPLLEGKDYVAFDLEWTDNDTINRAIYAAAFVDNHGNSKVSHVSDFLKSDNLERELLLHINQELSRYDLSIGWYSAGVAKYHEDTQEYLDGVDSDLATLHSRCLANGIDSVVDFNRAGVPYVKGRKHIDLHSVFSKPMVQTTIFKNAYRTLRLDEVSTALVSSEQSPEAVAGKYKGLTGKEVQSLPVEEQKKYVLRDAELVMQLSKHNNGEVLDAMKSISEITGLDFERVCRTGISTWWAAIFDNLVQSGECELPAVPLSVLRIEEKYSSELQYVGGNVLQPKKGLYHDLIVVDVTSLYPTMAILHNLSFDTVNCECCRDDLQCRIAKDITNDCKIQEEYWVCKQKEGAFPKKLKIFREERLKQKKLGNHVKQLAFKVLLNAGYGVMGSPYFKYYDPRVAELITAHGRYTISKMKDIAQKMGFEIVYGDTDSLFLRNGNDKTDLSLNIEESVSKFKEKCIRQLGIEVEHAKTYKTAILSDKKKHYVGWTGVQGKEPDIVGMEGDKNDRPKWINSVFRQTVCDIVTSSSNNGSCDPIANLRKAISDLQSGCVNPDLLKRSHRLSKNPEEYENKNDRKRKIGLAIGARKGDVIEYFEADNKEGYSLNPQEINIRKYKVMLWKAVKDILEIAGYDTAALEQELILNSKSGQIAEPPSGLTGYAGNIQQPKVAEVPANQSANKVK